MALRFRRKKKQEEQEKEPVMYSNWAQCPSGYPPVMPLYQHPQPQMQPTLLNVLQQHLENTKGVEEVVEYLQEKEKKKDASKKKDEKKPKRSFNTLEVFGIVVALSLPTAILSAKLLVYTYHMIVADLATMLPKP